MIVRIIWVVQCSQNPAFNVAAALLQRVDVLLLPMHIPSMFMLASASTLLKYIIHLNIYFLLAFCICQTLPSHTSPSCRAVSLHTSQWVKCQGLTAFVFSV